MRKLLILSLLFIPLVLHGETPKQPKDKELKALVFDSLFAFNKAVQEKNFEVFYGRTAKVWQKQTTPQKLLEIFQSFVDQKINIAPIAKLEPTFDGPPAINGDGVLAIKGSYPTQPSKTLFQLKYIFEDESWKLVGINVEVKPTADKPDKPDKAGKVPTNKELKTLALDSLLLFNVAVQTKSFEDFYGHISKIWQKQITPEKLLNVFHSFVDQKINIALIVKEDPEFDGTPAINDDGVLVIKGSYPTQPSKVFFELKYVAEGESWKLIGINVQVKPTGETAGKKGTEKKKDDSDDDDDDDDED
jgi:hypothetical protein